MQLFPCPFCGPRDETEFHYGGDAGNARPDGADVPIERWANYLHMRGNPKGVAREVWVHMNCSEFFVMERDTVTHEVLSSTALDGGHAQ
ncbi:MULTISPECIES: sarcosine oxidase subunit delta [unclassified Mesorhizobium]|jgi:sarcosine oxidase subunit delta|uniref:sarcosine oxidase subunit delta n=1 Tax=unclassified Mesorhizobium TaxID=325217 RepID=UPI00086D0CE0|nr:MULTISPECIES: sarcosine oxidase subunit delta [unclassified Mesorhizobium]MBN9255500.1 sarcosine oxidase subunit delta [Mesorhizobium sp.]ODT20558.1 MAG: sarcosine oxidase subunit delta [Mesorhizobium sp. SCN 65-12]OJX83939.1 MAG: sarcosine oxidase subunit delta [Mesorhizobium sp. 65-26]